MTILLAELLAWLALLQRPAVLAQLLPLALLLPALLALRNGPGRRSRLGGWLAPLPPGLPLLLGQGVVGLLLALAGQRFGLVLLLGQITLAWVGLSLLESQVLRRWLASRPRRILATRLLRPLLMLAVLLVLLDAAGSLTDLARLSLGTWFGSQVSLGQLAEVVLVLYLVLASVEVPAGLLSQLLQQGLRFSEGSRRAAEQILRYLIVSLAVVWGVTRLGFNQTGVLAIAGGLSVGLGFGITELFSNIVSGLWLLIEGSVRPGEVLIHDGETCEVRRLGPRATTLWRRTDDAELVVPNQTFFTSTTTSYSGRQAVDHRGDAAGGQGRRCTIALQVERQQPPREILRLLEEIATAQAGVLARPAVQARLLGFGPELYHYQLCYSIADPLRSEDTESGLRLAIHDRFSAAGIAPPA